MFVNVGTDRSQAWMTDTVMGVRPRLNKFEVGTKFVLPKLVGADVLSFGQELHEHKMIISMKMEGEECAQLTFCCWESFSSVFFYPNPAHMVHCSSFGVRLSVFILQ